jgi:general secretion pathway protein L
MQVAIGQFRAASLSASLRRLQGWWLEEFTDLLPTKLVRWLGGPGKAVMLVSLDGDQVDFELRGAAEDLIAIERVEAKACCIEFVEQLLREHKIGPKDVDIGVKLSAHSIFSRELQLPSEARRQVEAISIQDLVKKTPFKPTDIFVDHIVVPRQDTRRIFVQQWIVRKQYVADALSKLNMSVDRVTFVTSPTRQERRPFIKLAREDVRDLGLRRLTVFLSCSALALAMIGGGLKFWSQQREMDRLVVEVAAANKKAQQVRALADELKDKKSALARLRVQRSAMPGVIDLWDEVTRILPSHTWLTEFRLSETSHRERQLSISGFSNGAPSLVSILDGSPMFSEVALTSPVAFDSSEGRERFSLQAKVRVPETQKDVAR